ncbi:MAG: hypothetical protein NZM11_01330 [Anaerolineales bacterium]|nr:hypothetical protein [Anaerolineales bacterium]
MHKGDPRFATCPSEPGIQQLRWYIRQAAAGTLPIDEFLRDFRRAHEDAERAGNLTYASDEESRAVWDVLWAMEFAAANRMPPGEGYSSAEVLAVVRRAAKHLAV